jgi:hypothetical protein
MDQNGNYLFALLSVDDYRLKAGRIFWRLKVAIAAKAA